MFQVLIYLLLLHICRKMEVQISDEDWQMNKSVLQSNEHMLENQLFCDVTFVFNTKHPHRDTEDTQVKVKTKVIYIYIAYLCDIPINCALSN